MPDETMARGHAEQELEKLRLRIMAVKQYLRRTQQAGEHPTAIAVRAILDGEDDA